MPDKYVVPLTHAEKRIYLTQKLYPESSMWNIPFSLRLAHADLERLQEAVRLTVGSLYPGVLFTGIVRIFQKRIRIKGITADMMRGSGILYRGQQVRRPVPERFTHESFAEPIRKVFLPSCHTSQDSWQELSPVIPGSSCLLKTI